MQLLLQKIRVSLYCPEFSGHYRLSSSVYIHSQPDSMCWFSHWCRTGGRHNCITYLLMDVVELPTAMPTSVCWFFAHWLSKSPQVGPMTPNSNYHQIRTQARFLYMHLIAKFHHPMFNHSEVIMLINKQTDKQTDVTENIHLALLCYTDG